MKKIFLLFPVLLFLSCTGDDIDGETIRYSISDVSGGIDIVYRTKSGINAYRTNMAIFEQKEAPFAVDYASITVETEANETCTFSIEHNGKIVRSQTVGENQTSSLTYNLP